MEDQGVDRNKLSSQDAGDDFLSSEVIVGARWERLAPAPRSVPKSVCLRLAFFLQTDNTRLTLRFGGFSLITSLFLMSTGDPSATGWYWGSGLLGMALVCSVALVVYARTLQAVAVLSRGEIRLGRIVQVYDGFTKKYVAYESMLEEIDRRAKMRLRFNETVGSKVGVEISSGRHKYNDLPGIIRFEDTGEEVNARVDLRPMISKAKPDSWVRTLVADCDGRQRLMITEQYPWLSVSDTGEWESLLRPGSEEFRVGKSLAFSFVLILPTYLLVVCDYLFGANPLLDVDGSISESFVSRMFWVVLFTLMFPIAPTLFFHQNPKLYSNGLFVGVFYGVPILFLASMSGWFSVIWIALCVVGAGRGRRRWAFIQVGATAWSLILFLMAFSRAELFPAGLFVVLVQVVLLTLLDWKGKHLWVKQGATE